MPPPFIAVLDKDYTAIFDVVMHESKSTFET